MGNNKEKQLEQRRKSERKRRALNPEKHREEGRKHYAANSERVCKETRKHRLKGFGLTPEQYDALLLKQNGVCACCGKPPNKIRLAIDHDHLLEKNLGVICVRGLLCGACNRAIGVLGDDVAGLRRAIAYLGGQA